MSVVKDHKFIKQTKVLRLACYRAYKYVGTPEAECVFGYSEINEKCKNCTWFKIIDETRKVQGLLEESILHPEQPITLTLNDLPKPRLDLLP